MAATEIATPAQAANENLADDQDRLGLADLAHGVLARDFRPRITTVRRLAEAVLALEAELADLRKVARKTAKPQAAATKTATKTARKGAKKKKRKLAKIPGQKGK